MPIERSEEQRASAWARNDKERERKKTQQTHTHTHKKNMTGQYGTFK
jgi:hypothetical protein